MSDHFTEIPARFFSSILSIKKLAKTENLSRTPIKQIAHVIGHGKKKLIYFQTLDLAGLPKDVERSQRKHPNYSTESFHRHCDKTNSVRSLINFFHKDTIDKGGHIRIHVVRTNFGKIFFRNIFEGRHRHIQNMKPNIISNKPNTHCHIDRLQIRPERLYYRHS